MRRSLALLCLACALLAACARAAPPLENPGGACGDDVCNGPENALTCPVDCDISEGTDGQGDDGPSLPSVGVGPPLYFFYVIHTHVSGDTLPYDPGLTQVDAQVAENMIAAINSIRESLDRYGIPGSWQAPYGVAAGLCEYGGPHHIYTQLLAGGHEVGLHAHRTEDISIAYDALVRDCGITPIVGSGHLLDASRLGEIVGEQAAQGAMTLSLGISSDLGVTVVTENLSPGGGKNVFSEACSNQLGVGNTMWEQTGNLMFPWRPDYLNGDICVHNPQGDVIFIDHVSIEFALSPQGGMPDVWGATEFGILQQYLDNALAYMQQQEPDRIAVWGFVSHITEYALGAQGENPPHPSALAALDQFLAYVDSKRALGLLQYATPGQIAEMLEP